MDAIANGGANISAVGERLRLLEGRLAEIAAPIYEAADTIELHPNAIELYRSRVADLASALNADNLVRDEATAVFRGLVDKIVAYPAEKRGHLELELHGQLAAILNCGNRDNNGGGRGTGIQPSPRRPSQLRGAGE